MVGIIKTHKPNFAYYIVPTMMRDLMRHADWEELDIRGLRTHVSGEVVPPEIEAAMRARAPWDLMKPGGSAAGRRWELYHVARDFSQARNLAGKRPDKLADLLRLYRENAPQAGIPPEPRSTAGLPPRPQLNAGRTHFEYGPEITAVPESAAPETIGKSFEITVDIQEGGPDSKGVLLAQGGRFGGLALFIEGGRPVFHYNAVGERQYRISAHRRLPDGPCRVTASFDADSSARGTPGTLVITVDGIEYARGRIAQTLVTWISHTEGLDVGQDLITPVSRAYISEKSQFSEIIARASMKIK